jgi:hypothetical protein
MHHSSVGVEAAPCTPLRPPRTSGRRAWTLALAGLAAAGSACALMAPEPPALPGAAPRIVDIYVDAPEGSGPIPTGDAAIERALGNDTLLRHLQTIDSRYSGRRRKSLNWSARAVFTRNVPAPAEGEDAGGDDAGAVAQAVESDGGYWEVAVESDVRETQIFYVCKLRLAKSGEYLASFETREGCAWESR